MRIENKVQLIGYYGGDETHALSAWTSTHRELTEERRGRLGKMLRMLAASEPAHTSPFEKSCLHFLVDAETASHIHLIKHRIGVSINAESARYKEHKEDKWHVPSDWPSLWQHRLQSHCFESFSQYHECLRELEPIVGRKRAKESARFFLPYASSLTFDVMFNFQSFMHFQKLRNSKHAQREIQLIAQDMMKLVVETGAFNKSIAAFEWRNVRLRRIRTLFARINSMGNDEQSAERFSYARACAQEGYQLMGEVMGEDE